MSHHFKLRDYQVELAGKGAEILKRLGIVYFTMQNSTLILSLCLMSLQIALELSEKTKTK